MVSLRQKRAALLLSSIALLASACKDDPAPVKESAGGDAGPPRASGVDKDLAEAVAAIAGGAGPAASAGPPTTGVFGPGAADREMPPGAFPRLSLGGKGSEPTVTFAPTQRKRTEGVVQVAVQMGPRSAMPIVDLQLSVEPSLPRAAAAEGATEGAAAASPAPAEVVVRVTAAKLPAEQPGEIPAGLAAEIAKMKGSRLSYLVDGSGGGRLTKVELASGIDESLGQIVRSGADALGLAFLPYPKDPVGVGAFWMVTSRETFAGLDVVAYRMVKLEKLEGDRAILSVNTKRYTAGGQLAFQGLPPHRIEEFAGATMGQVAVSHKDPALFESQLTDVIQAGIAAEGAAAQAPGQKMGLELRVRTRTAVGKR